VHWDREWYRSFEEFRSRLVGTVDRVLDLCAADPEYRFVLDGQTVVLDDYLALRPHRRAELAAAVRGGRVGVGPWYVQPDSLLPSGEAHVRNLLLGRRVAEALGACSRVAYVPDSFGHPAQLPQLFAGFGLGPFVYWRGNGDEIDELGPVWRWRAPDGSSVVAWHLSDGYFSAAGIDADPATAPDRLAALARRQADAGHDPVLLMNGFDHLPPDTLTADVAAQLAMQLDAPVTRALLDDAASMLDAREARCFKGALLGARVANLLPGVWSSRMPQKLANRRAQALLEGWAEPWAALGQVLGLDNERPALELAWRSLLQSQAHDSLCGCSIDRVHEQVQARLDTVVDVAETTTTRVLERLAGRVATGALEWTDEHELVVFNPSPFRKTGIVRVALDAFPPWRASIDRFDLHPLALKRSGFTVDGAPARVVASEDPARVRFLPDQAALDLEVVAPDVPAFGCRRAALRPGPPTADVVDDGSDIEADDVIVRADPDGTLAVRFGDRAYDGLFAFEDCGDRGDSYDFDALPGDVPITAAADVSVTRMAHESGIRRLRITRALLLPAGLDDARTERMTELVACPLVTEVVVAPGVPWVGVTVAFENRARDHRLRIRFPTGAPATGARAATTFDVMACSTTLPDDSAWLHAAPAAFPHQGWIEANGLVVGAPGLPEAEVTAGGTVLVTLVRSVGWLARFELGSRPIPAGPEMPAPGAQVIGAIRASLVLARDPAHARDAELGLRGVLGGPEPLLEPGRELLRLTPPALALSACKPADDGDGLVVRVLNATGAPEEATLTVGFELEDATAVRLDEMPSAEPLARDGSVVRFAVPPHSLRSVRLRPR
jgi:hypothetical protein